jgi:hypothetical protein
MPRITEANLKPISKKPELSGSEKAKKRKKEAENNATLAAQASKFFRPSTSVPLESGKTKSPNVTVYLQQCHKNLA